MNGYAPGTVDPVMVAPAPAAAVVAVAPCEKKKLLPAPVGVPVSTPVQLAPAGQQAMLFAASTVQWVPSGQQAFESPCLVHGLLYPLGQLLPDRRRS